MLLLDSHTELIEVPDALNPECEAVADVCSVCRIEPTATGLCGCNLRDF